MEETKEQQQTQQLSEFDELIIQYGQDLTFCDFLQCQGFDETRFAVPLQFWFDLNTKRDDEWFALTDEIINLIGFQSSKSNPSHNRSNLLAFIRNHFTEGIDFLTTEIAVVKVGRGGAQHKLKIQMKKRPFKKMLLKVGTKTSDLIHDYILDIENGAMRYILYQKQCELYRKDEEVTRLKALTDTPMLDSFRKNALTINKQKRTVYVFTSKRYALLDLYKIGISFSPKKRKMSINTTHVLKDDEFYQVHAVECYDADIVEKYIHDTLDQYRYRKEREFFLLPLPLIKTVIDSVASLFNDCYDRINDAIETWNKPTCIAETHTQLPLQQSESTPTKTESNPPRVEQTPILMEVTYNPMDINNLEQLCTICNEHSVDIKLQHILQIFPDRNLNQNLSLRNSNISIINIKRLAMDLRIIKGATINNKELLLQNIDLFLNSL